MGNTVGRVIPSSHTSENDAAKIALSLYWTCRTGNHHVAGNLIARGADVNVRHPDSGEGALHAATLHGHFKVIKVLLTHNANPNLRSAPPHDETPLHCAVTTAQNPRAQWIRSRALQCVKLLLLERNIKVDMKDYNGFTAVHSAVSSKLWDFAECLIAAGANIDISIDGETAREILEHENPSLLAYANTKIETQISIKSKLFEYIRYGKQDKFIARISTESSINKETLQRLLHLASVNGYTKIVKHLIDLGADPYCSKDHSQTPAIILAARQGFHETLKVLIEAPSPKQAVVDHPLWRRTALHHVAISAAEATVDTECVSRNLVTCVSLLLKNSKHLHLDVNAKDFRGNTALQYAAKTYLREIVKLLLKYDSSLILQNEQNIPVFLNIHTRDLEQYFDSRIKYKGCTKSDRCHSITFDYNFLEKPMQSVIRPRKLSLVQNTTTCSDDDEDDFKRSRRFNTLEMEPLLLLSRSAVHRPLLKHPIVTSFLHLKWQRVKFFFYINFILYFLFTIFLSLHIHFLISAHKFDDLNLNETNITSQNLYGIRSTSSHNIIRWLAALFLLWPLCREILEMLMSPRRYVRNIENIMETTLVILSIILIFMMDLEHDIKQMLCAVAILLTYTDLVFLIGRHPRFSTYITMFTRVSRNFLGFFFLFSFLIFAFAFSFFIIFHNCLENDTCESKLFSDLGSSIFKTIIMLTGELEAESIKFNLFGYFIFTGFVVFITICLLNLLTGLAVSDITAIREEAEVDSCRAKVKLYAKIESILLGHSIEGLNNENWFVRRLQVVASTIFAGKIRLLRHLLPENYLEVYLNVDNRMEPDVQARSWRDKLIPTGCMQGQFSTRNLEWDAIVAEAHAIVGSGGVGGASFVQADTQRVMDRLDALEAKLNTLMDILQPNTDDIFSVLSSPAINLDLDPPKF